MRRASSALAGLEPWLASFSTARETSSALLLASWLWVMRILSSSPVRTPSESSSQCPFHDFRLISPDASSGPCRFRELAP